MSSHPLSTSDVDASCTLTQAQRSYSPLEKTRRPHYFLIKAISPVSVWSLFTIVTGQTDHFFSCLAQRNQILFMLQHDLRALVISLRHTTTRLILVKLQHLLMQTACHISLYFRLDLPNVKRSSNIFCNLKL